jgi:hypothetical protein
MEDVMILVEVHTKGEAQGILAARFPPGDQEFWRACLPV